MESDKTGLPDRFLHYLKQNPLVRFSVYTDGQVKVVVELGQSIIGLLDQTTDSSVDARTFQVVYGRFWLWVLGAYEVVRTMVQAKACFSPASMSELQKLKKDLARIRIPFAKQEFRGKKLPISNEISVSDIDVRKKDFVYVIEGVVVSVRDTISDFDRAMCKIKPEDVLMRHQDSYP